MEFSLGESINRSGPDWNLKRGSDTCCFRCRSMFLPVGGSVYTQISLLVFLASPATARQSSVATGREWHHTGWIGPFIYIFCE